MMEGPAVPSILTKWFTGFREDLLAGRVSLDELVATADADMQAQTVELCPECSRHPIRTDHKSRVGMCSVCWLHRLRDAHLEELARMQALREVQRAKQSAKRARDRVGVVPTRAWSRRTCLLCGTRFIARVGGDTDHCPECAERVEARQARRANS